MSITGHAHCRSGNGLVKKTDSLPVKEKHAIQNDYHYPPSPPRHLTLRILFQKYILGYLARIVFFKTGQEKNEQERTSNKKAESNSRNFHENDKNEVARRAVNKWRKRKIPITMFSVKETTTEDDCKSLKAGVHMYRTEI